MSFLTEKDLRLIDQASKQSFQARRGYDYSSPTNKLEQNKIHEATTSVILSSFDDDPKHEIWNEIQQEWAPWKNRPSTALSLDPDTTSEQIAEHSKLHSNSKHLDAYLAARPYIVWDDKERELTLKSLQQTSSISPIPIEEDKKPDPPSPSCTTKNRIEEVKKLIRENAQYRSNWEVLSDEEKEKAIQESYARLESKQKKEIDEKSAPKLNDDKNNKLNKIDKPSPKVKPCHKLQRDFTGLDPVVLKRMETGNIIVNSGCNNNSLREPVPIYNKSNAEVSLGPASNNSWIILGRDRPGNLASGYGGKCHTQCGAIDIVVGRMGHKPREVNSEGKRIKVDSSFTTDSARIYISQKTDIDKNFNLAKGKVGIADTKSAIGIKADHVRIIAREGIKLITRTDLENSQGCKVTSVSGIDLIAGNDDRDLQPLAKGKNLSKAIERLASHQEFLNGIVYGVLEAQMQLNQQLALHAHPWAGPAGMTSPSPTVDFAVKQTMLSHYNTSVADLKTHITNLNNWRANYLKPIGDGYILSRYNNVN